VDSSNPSPRHRGDLPSRRLHARGWLAAFLLAATLINTRFADAPPAVASEGSPTSPTSGPSFWDSYIAARDLLRWRPDSARALADSLLFRDPDDFLARWLSGAHRAGRDSTGAEAAVRAAAAAPDRAGLQVESGVILLARNRTEDGRAALDHARAAYRASARPLDECRAVLWKFKHAWDRGNSGPFVADIAEAESLARRAGDPATLADVLILKGGNATRRDNDLAHRSFQEALDLLAPLGTSHQLTGAYRGLGLTSDRAGDHAAAGRHYQRAFELAEAQRDTFQAFSALGGLGFVQMGEEDYTGALRTLERAQGLAFATRDPRAISKSHNDLAVLYLDVGQHLESRAHFQQAIQVMKDARLETDNTPVTMVNLANLELLLGDYEAARRRLEEALALCRKRNIKITTVSALSKLSRLNRELGDLAEAQRNADEALALAREAGLTGKESTLLADQARVLNLLHRPAEALVAARTGKAIAREREPRDLWHLVLDEAAALDALGRRREAIVALDSILAAAPEVPDSSHLEQVLLLKGDLLLRGGEVGPALATLERGMAIARAVGTPPRIADARLTLGEALLAAGRPRESAETLEQGLAWFETIQSEVKASQERSAYQSHWHDGYVVLARAYAASSLPARAFATLERSRARELRRLFMARRTTTPRHVPAALAARVERLESDLATAQASLLGLYAQPAAERSRAQGGLERRVDSLKTEWERLQRRVQREAPDFARSAGLMPAVSPADLQRSLRPGDRVIAFMVGTRASLIFDVSSRSLRVDELPWGEDSLAREVEAVCADLRGSGGDATSVRAARLAERLMLTGRFDAEPPAALYIVPDAALHHLPFEILPATDKSGRQRYLVETCPIVYAGSVTLLLGPPRATVDRAGPGPGLVAFGDPSTAAVTPGADGVPATSRGPVPVGALPHARAEVEQIARRFPDARTFVGEEATEHRFYEEGSRARMLHVAAHAFVDEVHPEFSGIVLASAGSGATEDGMVQAFEVMGQRFDLDLVVLSACETGQGRLERGEGLIGLARAFQLAGARNLVVSLWKVDDAATAAFMDAFYARLAAGEAPAAALRGAKLELVAGGRNAGAVAGSEARGVVATPRQERHTAPSTWAAFVLLGTRPL